MVDIVLVDGDDWQGCYKDGVLVDEGHSFVYRDLIEMVVGETVDSVDVVYPDMDWLYEQGSLPKNLEDVVLES